MDKICISNLEIYAHHGVFEEEKKLGQKFIVSLELSVCLRKAGKSDMVKDTINYAMVCQLVTQVMTGKSSDLIEHCAECIAEAILVQYSSAEKVVVEIKKPWAPIGNILDYVSVKIKRGWHNVFLGMGSNLGDKNENIRKAIEMIQTAGNQVINKSSFYVTSPVGGVEQDDFLNCCLEIRTLNTARELLSLVLEIEHKLKRIRTVRFGPRTIDIDILLYDHDIYEEEDLIVPHPRLQERMFVLAPLCEIKGSYVHPVFRKRLEDIKINLEETQNQNPHLSEKISLMKD